MKGISLGFVGVGQMGQAAHLRSYAGIEGCRVAAVAEPRRGLASAVADRYGIPSTYSTAAEMLEAEDLDGIVAIQPFDRHGQILPELYLSGLPVFTEKPLAVSTAVGKQLLAQLATTEARHMVGYHKRCDPASDAARNKIAEFRRSGELGKVQYIRATMPPGDWIRGGLDGIVRSDELPPVSAPDDSPPGSYVEFVNFYIHQVNLIRFLLDESFDVTYLSPGGVVLNGLSQSRIDVVLEMAPWSDEIGWNESVIVCFERGWIRLDLPAPLAIHEAGTVTVHGVGRGVEVNQDFRTEFGPVHAMLAQARRFVAVIRGEAQPPTDAADALLDLQIADQYLALQNGG